MRKISFYLIGFLLCFLISGCSQNTDTQEYIKTIFAMDTVMDLKIYSDNGNNALEEAENEILRIEKLFDRGNKNSEIYKINQNKITLKQTRACFKHPPERTKITQQFTSPLPLWYSIIV